MSRCLLIAVGVLLVVVWFSAAEGLTVRKARICRPHCFNRCGVLHKRQRASYWICLRQCDILAKTCQLCYGPRRCAQCISDYRLTSQKRCVYDLCVTNNGGCSSNANCLFINGNVNCMCQNGFSGDGRTCTDIDECQTNYGDCSSNANCTNTFGSYRCSCFPGYGGDGASCTDIDECLTNNGGCSLQATCANIPDSRLCTCNSGFTGDGLNCTDIDECAENTDNCSLNAACDNTIGSFTCTCNIGFYGNGTTCTAYAKSCLEIKNVLGNLVPSGEYPIWIARLASNITVYCEMGIDGGGYTFLDPFVLPMLIDADIDELTTDSTKLLLRARNKDGSQPYAILQQLDTYSQYPVRAKLSDYTNYTRPKNVDFIGPPYFFIGVLPASVASVIPANRLQGFKINGVAVTFNNCDGNANNYFAVFPNFHENSTSRYQRGNTYNLVRSLFNNLRQVNSRRVMPDKYFMFFEMHFGGCGAYTETDGRNDALNNNYQSVALGFQ